MYIKPRYSFNPYRYDLTHTMSPYMDPHMMFPLLAFLEENSVYDHSDLLKARLELLGSTYLYDFAIETYCELHGTDEAPESLENEKVRALFSLKRFAWFCSVCGACGVCGARCLRLLMTLFTTRESAVDFMLVPSAPIR